MMVLRDVTELKKPGCARYQPRHEEHSNDHDITAGCGTCGCGGNVTLTFVENIENPPFFFFHVLEVSILSPPLKERGGWAGEYTRLLAARSPRLSWPQATLSPPLRPPHSFCPALIYCCSPLRSAPTPHMGLLLPKKCRRTPTNDAPKPHGRKKPWVVQSSPPKTRPCFFKE